MTTDKKVLLKKWKNKILALNNPLGVDMPFKQIRKLYRHGLECTDLQRGCSEYNTQLHLMVRLHFLRSVEGGISL